MIISIDAEKTFDKIQYSFIIKTFNKLEIEGNFLNLIKGIYEKSTANIIFNVKRLKAFSLKRGTRIPLSPLPFNTVLDVLDKPIKQVKLFLFADEMISYVENPKEYIHTKLLELINKFCKVPRHKTNI